MLCSQLNLAHNKIGGYWDSKQRKVISTPEGPKAIADALLVNAELTSINLRGNNLGVEGWTAIFTALRDHPRNKIKEWDLSSMSAVVPEIIPVLAEYISVSAELTKIE